MGPVRNEFWTEKERIRALYAKQAVDVRHSWFNSGFSIILQERERHVLHLLRKETFNNLSATRILEVGCGAGAFLRDFVKWGARPENIFGVDLLDEHVAEAKALCPPGVSLLCRDASSLDFPDEGFDLVFQSTMFSSILDDCTRRGVASEMVRVVKRDGLILWDDFHMNNPKNPDVRGVKRREINALFHGCGIKMRRITLAPPLARCIAPYSPMACEVLAKIPWLCTHYLASIRKG